MIERELIDYMLTSGVQAATCAATRIMEIYQHDNFDVNLKSDNTINTSADRESHDIIKNMLSKTRIPLLSEEGRSTLYVERYRWDLYWLIDPLDGTKEFVKHIDEFVVCISLMSQNRPLIGIIAVPALGKLYFSDPDRGAFCIDNMSLLSQQVTISELFKNSRQIEPIIRDNKTLRVAVSKSHKVIADTEYIIDKQRQIYDDVEVIECGSSLKFCKMIEGEVDACFRLSSLLEWDIAAAHALVKAVGGQVAHLDSREIMFNSEDLTVEPFYASCKSVIL